MITLVVGGTGFLGSAIVDAALNAGHDVTILTRGQTKRPQASNVKVLTANRYNSLDALKNQNFDYVFDTCAFTPDAVENLLNAVGNSIQRYIMVSSISVYDDFAQPLVSENNPTPNASKEDFEVAKKCIAENNVGAFALGVSYGPLKRACEIMATKILGERAVNLRAGLLVGAGDYTDRLTWWVRRIDLGGTIPLPMPKDRLVQIIDVRDAARFAMHAATNSLSGIYNLTGQPFPLSQLIDTTINITGSDVKLNWVEDKIMQEANIQYWSELPLIAPMGDKFSHFLNVDTSKAYKDGLTIRPLSETLIPLLQWNRTRRDIPLKCGLPQEKEQLVLKLAQTDV